MSHRKIISILLSLSGIILVIGLVFRYSVDSKLCLENDYNCIDFWTFSLGHPIVLGLIPFVPILILLLFFPKEVFKTWSRFAIVLIPIIIGLIVITPIQCDAPLGLCFDKKSITWFLSESFAVISIIIIIIKAILVRRKANQLQKS